MDIKEVAELTPAELRVKEAELRQELFNLRLQARSGRVEKPSRIRDLRRDIARVQTVLSRATQAKQPEASKTETAKA